MSNSFYRDTDLFRDEEEDFRSRQSVDKWIFNLLIIAIILVPLMIGGHVSEVISPHISNKAQLSSGYKGDIFTFYKFVVLSIITIFVTGLFLYKLFFLNYVLPKRPILYFILCFILAILVSTILSESISISLFGQYNRTDGAFSYICYTLLFFVAMNINYPRKAVEYVLYALYPIVVINFILTTMNFTGNDILKYDFFQKSISVFLPEGATLGEGSQILGTLNHFNYMSGTFIIITLMYLIWVIVDNNKIRKIVNLIFAIISMSIMLMAMSASGFVTFICFTPLVIWILFKSNNRKISIIYLVIFYAFTALIIHVLSLKNPEAWDESVGFFLLNGLYEEEQVESTSLNNTNVDVPSFWGESVSASSNTFTLPELPESAWGAGTGRIYIWTETLKLVKDRPLFGYGLDTLMYNFPHDNLEARGSLTAVTVVDKPHNLYVGIIYGTGIIGLVGFLGLILITVWFAIREIISFKKSSGFVIILCIGWLAFLFQALFNDSLPGTTSMMFIIGGVMMGLIYKENNNTSSESKEF